MLAFGGVAIGMCALESGRVSPSFGPLLFDSFTWSLDLLTRLSRAVPSVQQLQRPLLHGGHDGQLCSFFPPPFKILSFLSCSRLLREGFSLETPFSVGSFRIEESNNELIGVTFFVCWVRLGV